MGTYRRFGAADPDPPGAAKVGSVPYSHASPPPRGIVSSGAYCERSSQPGRARAAESRAMANIASQKKRIARSARERQENLRFASAVKTHMKRLEKAVAAGDDAAADEEHRKLVSRVDKAIQKGAMHKNTGARKKARAARVRAGDLSDAPEPESKPAAEPEAAESAGRGPEDAEQAEADGDAGEAGSEAPGDEPKG